MALTENQKQARYNYAKKNLKRIPLDVQKEKYDIIKAAADNAGESVNGYIKRAIDERLERDNINPAAPAPVAPAEPKNNGLPDYLTPEVLKHIDRSKFAHDTAYQLEIGKIIGINNLSALADWLKNN